MTNWLKIFLAFYILVGQPALLGWMMDNYSLYQLAWLNAWVFLIARLISVLCKSSKSKDSSDNTSKVIEKSEEKISRIENDNWVAVVSMEKKQEVVVESLKNEDQEKLVEWLVTNKSEDSGEKVEENLVEKIPERPMRESVSIPKIVQPLSWHSVPKKKQKEELKWWQWLVLLITLGLAAVVAWTLWVFLWGWWIAVALFLGWLLYLVIWKLFGVSGFDNAKKLFTNWLYVIWILIWIGYGAYTMQQENQSSLSSDFSQKVSDYVKNRFVSDDSSELGTWDEIYVFEWTGEVILDSWLEGVWTIENESWDIENGGWLDEVNSLTVESSESGIIPQPEVVSQEEIAPQPEITSQEEITSTVDNPEREVTWWEAIKHLLQWYTLSTKTDKSFTYVAKSNELYPYFKTAQEKAMIWTDVNPNKRISCETYMSLKWILEWWSVNIYDRSQTRVIYWNKANELGKTNWCGRWGFVKVKNL